MTAMIQSENQLIVIRVIQCVIPRMMTMMNVIILSLVNNGRSNNVIDCLS